MAERFKFNDEEENIDENDNQQDDLEKEYYDNTDYSYTKSKNKKRKMISLISRRKKWPNSSLMISMSTRIGKTQKMIRLIKNSIQFRRSPMRIKRKKVKEIRKKVLSNRGNLSIATSI